MGGKMNVQRSCVCPRMFGMKLMDGMNTGGKMHGGSMGMDGQRLLGMKLTNGMNMGGNPHGGSIGMDGIRTMMLRNMVLTGTREFCTACHRSGSMGGSNLGMDGVRMSAIMMMLLLIIIGIMTIATSTCSASANEVPGVQVPSQRLHSRCSHASSRRSVHRTKTMAAQATTAMSFFLRRGPLSSR